MQKIGVCGHFGGKKIYLDGQTIKTKNLTDELMRQFGEREIRIIDTYGGVKKLPLVVLKLIIMLMKCRNIIILPAQNGLNSYVRMLIFLNAFFRKNIHYVVIGGWLPEYLNNKPRLMENLKLLKGIYVETRTMKNLLEKKGFQNVLILPNFKSIQILDVHELVYSNKKPLKLCTFSRVMKEKGIEDAIKAIEKFNRNAGELVFELDIYGQIDGNQAEWFEKLKREFPNFIRYKGAVPAEQSVNVLKTYYALLFPTNFYTEGIPGTIIDAYCAGIPVVCSKWESFSDVVDDKKTGFGYKFFSQDEFMTILEYLSNNISDVNKLKLTCIEKAKEYSPKAAIKTLVNQL